MPPLAIRTLARTIGSTIPAAAATILLAVYSFAGSGTLTVSGTQWGITSQYLGANEGSSQFNINDLVDLGINSYRMYGGMSRWEPTNAELETIAQTWSEHCSHKTLAGRIAYRDKRGERQFTNMLRETIFAATQQIRARLGKILQKAMVNLAV